jgi:hypothetical protein
MPSPAAGATFGSYSYDADGARVRKETRSEVTRYIGSHYEVTVAITNSQVFTTTK